MTDYFLATITKSLVETPLCQHIEVAFADPKALLTYTIPGQYVIFRYPGLKDGFFALADKPGLKSWKFLIKKVSPLATQVAHLPVGAQIEISQAQGQGYALEKAKGKNVLLFGVGSAIAPLRAVLNFLSDRRADYKDIICYYGAINSHEFAYREDFDFWQEKEIEVLTTVAPNPDQEWRGLTGYVQDHLDNTPLNADTVALVCGMQQMMDDVSNKLTYLGLPKENILTNY